MADSWSRCRAFKNAFAQIDVQLKRKYDLILNRLANLSPKVKQSLITACFQCLVHDKQITMKEAEFFRLLVYALDTPLPSWVKI